VPCAPTIGKRDLANEVPTHSEAIAPINDRMGSRVEDDALRPVFRVAAVMAMAEKRNA
jgi:hypothetical protein